MTTTARLEPLDAEAPADHGLHGLTDERLDQPVLGALAVLPAPAVLAYAITLAAMIAFGRIFLGARPLYDH